MTEFQNFEKVESALASIFGQEASGNWVVATFSDASSKSPKTLSFKAS